MVIQEISAGVLSTLDEAASALVAASVVPEVSQAEVAEWPSEVVNDLAVLITKMNGWDSLGKD